MKRITYIILWILFSCLSTILLALKTNNPLLTFGIELPLTIIFGTVGCTLDIKGKFKPN